MQQVRETHRSRDTVMVKGEGMSVRRMQSSGRDQDPYLVDGKDEVEDAMP